MSKISYQCPGQQRIRDRVSCLQQELPDTVGNHCAKGGKVLVESAAEFLVEFAIDLKFWDVKTSTSILNAFIAIPTDKTAGRFYPKHHWVHEFYKFSRHVLHGSILLINIVVVVIVTFSGFLLRFWPRGIKNCCKNDISKCKIDEYMQLIILTK